MKFMSPIFLILLDNKDLLPRISFYDQFLIFVLLIELNKVQEMSRQCDMSDLFAINAF